MPECVIVSSGAELLRCMKAVHPLLPAPDSFEKEITTAEILIACGQGMRHAPSLALAGQLAERLGATLCATRALVDAGLFPESQMVGLSGKRVSPVIYLALGVSGVFHHIVGVADSTHVFAVNANPDAPIFRRAEAGAVMDAALCLEQMLEELGAL